MHVPIQQRPRFLTGFVIVAVGFVISAALSYSMPSQIQVRWEIPGLDPDVAGRLEALFLVPLLGLMLTAFFWLLPSASADMTRGRVRSADGLFLLATVMMLAAHIVILYATREHRLQLVAETIWTLVYLFFIGLARFVRDLPPGHPLGFRLPWTAADDEIWVATHRMAWASMTVCGVAAIGLTLISEREIEILYTYAGLMFAVPIFYAWQLSHHRDDGEDDADGIAPAPDMQPSDLAPSVGATDPRS